jgi:hypothetical protein
MATSRKQWVSSPHTGGSKITPALQVDTRSRIERYAEQHFAGAYTRIDVRFRGALCYIDAFTEPAPPSRDLLRSLGESLEEHLARLRAVPTRLCRLRYFSGRGLWSMALYSYSGERFEPCMLPTGEFCGTPEECFALGASFYLTDQAG